MSFSINDRFSIIINYKSEGKQRAVMYIFIVHSFLSYVGENKNQTHYCKEAKFLERDT